MCDIRMYRILDLGLSFIEILHIFIDKTSNDFTNNLILNNKKYYYSLQLILAKGKKISL